MLEKDGEISWTNRVKNEEVLHRMKEERDVHPTVKRKKAIRIGHVLRTNSLLTHVIVGKMEGPRRQGKRHKLLLNDLRKREYTRT
jgi:hypothetical protein